MAGCWLFKPLAKNALILSRVTFTVGSGIIKIAFEEIT